MNPQSNFGKMDPYNDMEGIDEGPESSRRLINGKQSSRRNMYVAQSSENLQKKKGVGADTDDEAFRMRNRQKLEQNQNFPAERKKLNNMRMQSMNINNVDILEVKKVNEEVELPSLLQANDAISTYT